MAGVISDCAATLSGRKRKKEVSRTNGPEQLPWLSKYKKVNITTNVPCFQNKINRKEIFYTRIKILWHLFCDVYSTKMIEESYHVKCYFALFLDSTGGLSKDN